MDTTRYSKWGGSSEEVPGAFTERAALLGCQDLLRTNASKQTAALGALKEEIRVCRSCCEGARPRRWARRGGVLWPGWEGGRGRGLRRAGLDVLVSEVPPHPRGPRPPGPAALRLADADSAADHALGAREAQAKLMEQESALRELRERVTQVLAEAGRDREDVRPGLFLALEAVRLQNTSCEPCTTSWLPFGSSCYYFSVPKTTWAEAQGHCAHASARL
uniref:C-type lectin domain family 4 member G-like n=1 Tax=Macaca mulatta TaxID=9544 RepID=UPI0010A270BB|nr:C-type lectin domain family 4 member G-like [Macaca mulatta]